MEEHRRFAPSFSLSLSFPPASWGVFPQHLIAAGEVPIIKRGKKEGERGGKMGPVVPLLEFVRS